MGPGFPIEPTDAEGFCQRGVALASEGWYDEAIADLTEALRLDSSSVRARVHRGIAYSSLADSERAITDFTEAIRLDPQSSWANLWRGATYLQQNRIEDALADYDEAVRLDPEYVNAYVNRGVAHHRNEDYDAAIEDYNAALRLNPDSGRAHLYRGQAYSRIREYEQASADFTEAIRLDATCSEAYLYRGRIRRYEDDLDGALADFAEAIRLAPDNAEAYRDRGELWLKFGEHEKAIADFSEAIRLDPGSASAYEGRAEAWSELDQDGRAEADLESADQLDSEREDMLGRKNRIHPLLKAHFNPIALDDLTITERRFPNRVRADLQRAIDGLLNQMTVHHFCGVRKQYAHEGVNFTELVVHDWNDPPLSVPPQYEEIDIGEDEPVRCLKSGLWLLEHEGSRFAVFLEPGERYGCAPGIRFQVGTTNDEQGTGVAQKFFRHLEQAVQEARCYRGKILSLEWEEQYTGHSSGIRVHKLRHVERDQVILPRRTLELLERNVIQFVQQRARLPGARAPQIV